MSDSEWQKVTRKNRRSVFERLKPSQSQKSNVDELAKISLSVYVSNFPSHLTVRELWNICGKMGTLVDVYIAKRKNKLGQMFAFCRYIKVTNSNALIDSLSNVWIGKLRLHANVARFDRNATVKSPHANVKADAPKVANSNRIFSSSNANSYAFVAKKSFDDDKRGHVTVNVERGDKESNREHVGENSEIILSQKGNCGVVLAVVGCFKDFRSIVNAKIICRNEGFQGVETKYLGGLWVMFEFNDKDVRDKFLNHEGILSWFSSLKIWNDEFVVAEILPPSHIKCPFLTFKSLFSSTLTLIISSYVI
ncbi:reverse transcriptase domain, reverse transcriptase zinc-binding domain protein [Tanacetum coccineum]